MIHLLGFIFIIIIAVLLIGLSLISMFLRGIFSLGRRSPRPASAYTTASDSSSHTRPTTDEAATPRKKLFDKNEGEYVEFEEVN